MTLRRSFLATFAVTTLGLASLVGCATSESDKTPGDSKVVVAGASHAISVSDDGKTLAPAVGDTIVFTAEENPSTGYLWSAGVDAAKLEAGDSNYTPGSSDKQKVGVPGTRTMAFKVKAAGKSTLTLKYARSWEDSNAAKTVTVTVDAGK